MMPEPFAILKITRQEWSRSSTVHAALVGSCFLVAPTLVVTCQHVLAEAFTCERSTLNPCVVASTSRAFLLQAADIIGTDEERDLALLRLSDLAEFKFPTFQLATQTPSPDQRCIIRGYAPPKGTIQGCVDRGIHFGKRWYLDIESAAVTFDSTVIEIERTAHTKIRSRGKLEKGMSGSPLIDVTTGQVLGIQTTGSAPPPPWWTGPIQPETIAVGADEISALIARTPL
jgi:hypothetical protein